MCPSVSAKLHTVSENDRTELLRVVGGRARTTRERAGLTMRDLAERADVGTTMIGLFETGRSWPAPGVKRSRLERGYGWPPGAIDRAELGDLSAIEGPADVRDPSTDDPAALLADARQLLREGLSRVEAAAELIGPGWRGGA